MSDGGQPAFLVLRGRGAGGHTGEIRWNHVRFEVRAWRRCAQGVYTCEIRGAGAEFLSWCPAEINIERRVFVVDGVPHRLDGWRNCGLTASWRTFEPDGDEPLAEAAEAGARMAGGG